MNPKILYSLESAILFFIIASPFMYSLTSPLTKLLKAGPYGPIAVHALVFGIIVFGLMNLH